MILFMIFKYHELIRSLFDKIRKDLKIRWLKVKEGTARMTFLEGYELLDQIGESPFGESTDF